MRDSSWTDAEGEALRRATERSFPAVALPRDEDLVIDMRFGDMAQMAASCRGKTWRDLDGETLFTQFRSFTSLATDKGFCALVPAFIVQSIGAAEDYRVELKGTLMHVFELAPFGEENPQAWDAYVATTTRRMVLLSPAQRWVVREFLRLANTGHPDWYASLGSRFWESVRTTDTPSLRPHAMWNGDP